MSRPVSTSGHGGLVSHRLTLLPKTPQKAGWNHETNKKQPRSSLSGAYSARGKNWRSGPPRKKGPRKKSRPLVWTPQSLHTRRKGKPEINLTVVSSVPHWIKVFCPTLTEYRSQSKSSPEDSSTISNLISICSIQIKVPKDKTELPKTREEKRLETDP